MRNDIVSDVVRASDLNRAVTDALDYLWRTGHAVKTYDYYVQALERLVKSTYRGTIGETFQSSLETLIYKQMNEAYTKAWKDNGTGGMPPEYLRLAAMRDISDQQFYVRTFYEDIVRASEQGLPVDGLMYRVPLWANKWNEAYNRASLLIIKNLGGKMKWKMGKREKHCPTCRGLDGVVAYASEWLKLEVQTQNAPNPKLRCGGWSCGCRLIPTKDRRTTDALNHIRSIVKSTR